MGSLLDCFIVPPSAALLATTFMLLLFIVFIEKLINVIASATEGGTKQSYNSVIFLSVIYCLLFMPSAYAASPTQVCFKDRCFNVEVADRDDSRARGLQGRVSLEEDNGMLFVFDKEGLYNFWMKDTLIPLDIIWINQAKQVVDVKAGVPSCRESPCPTYVPSGEALYVLELNAGAAQAQDIHTGDKADFKNFL